ncbi:transcriptional regulator [Halococcus dombrowskii]|uniref:Thiamine-phosphate synthase family protein n=1 Tax=Halococcus dombrowskii TaxID=179637 RepID=A0AAV3SIX4_HALDO|nr:thiamine-phosphate synthase family protein [Halococcus dombrowskii]UOO96366.1 transcriptional regulator [Halococcus dombrowskii]
MSLRLPSEIVVERFLPTARSMLASELAERDFTQQEIADRLGVTQAAVSKSLGGDGAVEERFRENERMQATMARIADGFAADTMSGYEALAELLELIRAFEDRGPICAVHEEEMPALDGLGCDLCVRGSDDGVLAERDVLRTVRTAVRRVTNTPEIAAHVPKVGTNVATALPEAPDTTAVAAVPGRVHAVGGRVLVPAQPEFGASQHVAETLLAAMAIDPSVRGALNLATSDALLAAAEEHGIDPLRFDADYENRAEHLRERFRERGAVPRVIYHEGAFGIEPVTYLLGADAIEAAALAGDLVAAADG